jgi:uncharacterized protein (TIGR01777 family)
VPLPGAVLWNPEKNFLESSPLLDNLEACIHLAGDPLTLGRWSPAKKRSIFRSRVVGTQLLARSLKVRSFISASAIGYYGDRGEEILTEQSPPGSGFLSSVCKAWEEASCVLEDKGVHVAQMRFGVILDAEGGMLQRLLPMYRLGLGAVIGDGSQWVSWISRSDLVRAILFVLERKLMGPINAVSPHAVRQKELSQELARWVHRPHWLKVPAWAIRALLSTMGEEMLLASARVEPSVLLNNGFTFVFPTLTKGVLTHYDGSS